jgi:hypothetical protein
MDLRSKLVDKKIFFLSTKTFNLEVEIKDKLEELGAQVLFYDERPANNIFVKGIIRLNRSLIQNKIDQYYKKILSTTNKLKFDFLFVNKGEIVPEFFLKEFKKFNINCQFIFYTWDSFTNNPHPLSILKYFDRKFTFDSNDALKYKLNFRPLFFLDSFRDIKNIGNYNIKYNLLFIGTAHSDRYKISSEIENWCVNNRLRSYCFYYMHGLLVYIFLKYFDKSIKKLSFNRLSFRTLNKFEILEFYKSSDVVLDINHPGQSGLTMRTFESIGAGKKLITTNTEIKKYSFYNPNNIFIINRDKIKMDKYIFESTYENIDTNIYEKMSIEGWINCIFFDKESNFWIAGIE